MTDGINKIRGAQHTNPTDAKMGSAKLNRAMVKTAKHVASLGKGDAFYIQASFPPLNHRHTTAVQGRESTPESKHDKKVPLMITPNDSKLPPARSLKGNAQYLKT